MRWALWVALVASGASAQGPSLDRTPSDGAEWKVAFLHDADGSTLRFSDVQASSANCAVAFGSIHEAKSGAARGAAARSTDGGSRWEIVALDEVPRSGFLLGEKLGWMVTESGVWRTSDCAKTWSKIAARDRLIRAYFLDETRGYAVGYGKQALETRDGGKSWTSLATVEEIQADASRSLFQWVEFAGRFGMITGAHEPRRPASPTGRRRQLPSLLLTLQTIDGGESWKGSSASILGQLTRVRLAADGTGLAVIEFQDEFEWPSEVYRLNPRGNSMTRAYRESDRAVKDAITTGNGTSYIAAIEPPGQDWRLKLPGKVRIAVSQDQVNWKEMRVDYRAVASGVWLAAAPAGPVLAATDHGMILRVILR